MYTDPIPANIAKVLRELSTAAEKYRRDPASITLMAVSKTQPEGAVRAAAAAGLRHFGENYLQEAVGKIDACADLDLCWHYIGPIQSNKTRPIAEHFHWVHSVDREKVLRRLSEQRPAGLADLNICLQVNISGEDSKSGVDSSALEQLLAVADALPRLHLRGLMAIPAPQENFVEQKAACDQLAALFARAQQAYPSLDTLSMGMSADMEAAIAAGSTLLRIGTAIFGSRRR
ncbi:MAG: pyridoxal phosphate enzyme (YggS family) [Halieaceae bacterium]|jgi:pyridoxal phosphate enzyme (YggS family)